MPGGWRDGTVLRISASRATAGLLILGVLQPMLLVLAAALILSGVLARAALASGSSTRSTGSTSSTRWKTTAYEELAPLLWAHQPASTREIDSQLRQAAAARRTSSHRSPPA